MEMFTCSGFSSGPRIFNFGTVASGIQSLWRRQENFLICVGKMTLNIVILGVTRTNTVHSADDTYIFYNSAFFKRYNWQSYNFEKYGLPVETPPIGKLLLYPIQVIWLLYCDNLGIFSPRWIQRASSPTSRCLRHSLTTTRLPRSSAEETEWFLRN